MPHTESLMQRVQNLFNQLAGIPPELESPAIFRERLPWEEPQARLDLPAAWRRHRV